MYKTKLGGELIKELFFGKFNIYSFESFIRMTRPSPELKFICELYPLKIALDN